MPALSQLIILDTTGHGVSLVKPGGGSDEARTALTTFLKAHSAS
jgi:hypothetical protein